MAFSCCSCLHSFQRHRRYFHAAVFRLRLDAPEHPVPHRHLECGKDFPVCSWMDHQYVAGNSLVAGAVMKGAPQNLDARILVEALTCQVAARSCQQDVEVDVASIRRMDCSQAVGLEDVVCQKDYFQDEVPLVVA